MGKLWGRLYAPTEAAGRPHEGRATVVVSCFLRCGSGAGSALRTAIGNGSTRRVKNDGRDGANACRAIRVGSDGREPLLAAGDLPDSGSGGPGVIDACRT